MTISNRYWHLASEILGAALECPPEERERFIRAECGGDSALEEEVRSLLSSDPESLERVDRQAFSLTAAAPPPDEPEIEGSLIGPYRVIRQLGRGGTGAVYLAARADGEFQREVAVKLLRRGMDSDEIVRRFHTERQILAGLEHPNIARFYDGGTTEDGRPYFVMEYVEGEPIDRWCDARRSTVRARLELFVKVCAAVQHAHQSLVIHRDLKPSNILVTESGEPKLLDFGIAKLVAPEARAAHTLTAPWQRPMTPSYASPEQLSGEPITTATDIYSLGVVLFLLLTGRGPYQLETDGEPELWQAISEQRPPRPSRAVLVAADRRRTDGALESPPPELVAQARSATPHGLARRLRGDLDTILLAALRKTPGRRYPTAENLGNDLRLHLAGRPVRARPDTFTYRVGKLLRRRRRAAVLATAAAVAGGFLLLDRWQLQKRTTEERDRAEQVSDFLLDLFDVTRLPDPTQNFSAEELLDRGAERLANELGEQPELEADLMAALGKGYRNLRKFEPAEHFLRGALERERRRRPVGNPKISALLAELGALRVVQGDFDAAVLLHREQLEAALETYGEGHMSTALARNALAASLMDCGRYDESAAVFAKILESTERLERERPTLVATTRQNLALVHYFRGSYAQAETLLRSALEDTRILKGANDPQTIAATANLATVLRERGVYEEAEELQRWALAATARLERADELAVAGMQINLGAVLLARGELEEAQQLLKASFESWEKQGELNHPIVAKVLHYLSVLSEARGEGERAVDYALRAVELRRRLLGDDHSLTANSLLQLATSHLASGQLQAAEDAARRGLEALSRALPAGNAQLALGESVLGAVLSERGRYAEAEPLLVESYLRLQRERGHAPRPTRTALERVVRLYESWGREDRARSFREAASTL